MNISLTGSYQTCEKNPVLLFKEYNGYFYGAFFDLRTLKWTPGTWSKIGENTIANCPQYNLKEAKLKSLKKVMKFLIFDSSNGAFGFKLTKENDEDCQCFFSKDGLQTLSKELLKKEEDRKISLSDKFSFVFRQMAIKVKPCCFVKTLSKLNVQILHIFPEEDVVNEYNILGFATDEENNRIYLTFWNESGQCAIINHPELNFSKFAFGNIVDKNKNKIC